MEDRFIPQPGASMALNDTSVYPTSSSHQVLSSAATVSAIDLTPWAQQTQLEATYTSALPPKAPLLPGNLVDYDVAAPHGAQSSTSTTSDRAPPSATTDSGSDESDEDMHDHDHGDLYTQLNASGSAVAPVSTTTTTTATTSHPPVRKRKPRPILPPGTIICDKSCIRCRERKVKCDRRFPTCHHCAQRTEECDLIRWTPKVKRSVQNDPNRIAHLEKRLGKSCLRATGQKLADTDTPFKSWQPNSRVNSRQSLRARLIPLTHLAVDGTAFDSSLEALFGLPASSTSAVPALPTADPSDILTTSPLATGTNSIGAFSLDWRLATPQMAAALSRHLCDAFFESCCFVLPTYTYFRSRKAELHKDEWLLSPSAKVAVAAFRAVGARTSPHSGLLGISIEAKDSRNHPDAPLFSAGTRRELACTNFLKQAHQLCFDEGLAEEASIENLGSLMTLMQMAMFVELKPKKSRSLLRSALDQYKQLIDAAPAEGDQTELKKIFGFGLYSADAQIAAFGRRLPCIDDLDLRAYFSHAGIVIPALPEDDNILPVLEKLLAKAKERPEALQTIRHLLHCWICTCQRDFAHLASPPSKPPVQIEVAVRKVWLSIDKTRSTIQHVLSALTTRDLAPPPQAHPTMTEHDHHHHENDYGPLIIRLDRDLLDLNNMLRSTLLDWSDAIPAPLLTEATSRVRKGLKTLAYYAKAYMTGADLHIIYHQFYNLELVQDWTTLAQERLGDVPGPTTSEEVVTEQEKQWLIEGLKMTCYYHPFAERRLAEFMMSRLVPVQEDPSLLLAQMPLASPTGLPASTNQSDFGLSIDALLNGDPFAAGTSLFASDNTFNTGAMFDFGPL